MKTKGLLGLVAGLVAAGALAGDWRPYAGNPVLGERAAGDVL